MRQIPLFALLCWLLTPVHVALADVQNTALPALSSNNPLQQLAQNILLEHPALQAAQADYNAALAQQRAADQPLYNPELEIDIEKTDINTRSLGINQSID